MLSIKNMRVGTRLGLGFGVLIVFSVVIALVAWKALIGGQNAVSLLVKDRVVKVIQVNEIKAAVAAQGDSVRNMALLKTDSVVKRETEQIRQRTEIISDRLSRLGETIRTEQGRLLLQSTLAARTQFLGVRDRAVTAALGADESLLRALVERELMPAQEKFLGALDALIAFQSELMNITYDETNAEVSTTIWLMLGLMVTCALVGALIAWRLARTVTVPLGIAVNSADRIAAGHLNDEIHVEQRDELGQLLCSMKEMQSSLSRVVGTVRENAESVTTASAEIAAGNQDLSSRTEQQAASLQETAASMEQLTSTVKQNAENARTANQLAQSASSAAAVGGQTVKEVVTTMDEITTSSRKIGDIIGVIDGIAFQTNILALNAAVEAARAGEQGRGFAVVATEVRALAQRSADAAKEIRTLISQSVARVEEGSRLVHAAGNAMQDIVTRVTRVTDLIGEITHSASEQSNGIEQVNQAVTQMDQVTQQNAALVEESAAAASSLKTQATQLVEAVAVFRLAGAH
jgi:methyl-accepting chemotaxis protein